MTAVPVSIHPNVVLNELMAISASAETQRDRIGRTESRINELKAGLSQAADHLGWGERRKQQHVDEIVTKLMEAKQLASTEQFAVLSRAIALLTATGNKLPALQVHS